MLSCQAGALHTPRHTHMATSPPWHERTLVSAHPNGSTHPRIAALLTLFLLSPKSARPPRPAAVADTAQLLSPSLAVAGLSQPPQPAASQACPSEPAGCGERGWSPGARLRIQEGRRQTPPARFQAGWVQSRRRGGRAPLVVLCSPRPGPVGRLPPPYPIPPPPPAPVLGFLHTDLCISVSAG